MRLDLWVAGVDAALLLFLAWHSKSDPQEWIGLSLLALTTSASIIPHLKDRLLMAVRKPPPKAPPPVPTHLLIDGDIIAFVAAAAAQAVFVDEAGWTMPMANQTQGEVIAENMLWSLKAGLMADSFEIILSDTTSNWRHSVDATYKTNRVGERPLLLGHLKSYLKEKYNATTWAGLEADDVLGILATQPREHRQQTEDGETVGGDRSWGNGGASISPDTRVIVVGRDKDFKSIPGLHHSWKQDVDADGNMLVREVSQWQADRFHLIQSLSGDHVDGFSGCPGIGMDRAASIIDSPTRLVPSVGVKTRGVNKGEAVTRWVGEPTQDYWACIVSHYQKAMTTPMHKGSCEWAYAEQAALTTARLARILRHGEYDKETETVHLWEPKMIRTTLSPTVTTLGLA